jgi:DNA-directed RNA polymerase subunit beta
MDNNQIYKTTLPDFIEIQRASFCWFISKGLSDELDKFSSIIDYTENIEICIFGNEYKLRKPKYNEFESKQLDSTYSARIYVPIEIKDKKLNIIIKKRNVFIGTLPIMTNSATFIVNGCERVIISQIIRSPGIYFKSKLVKTQLEYSATLIFSQGSWLKFEKRKTEYENDNEVSIKLSKTINIAISEIYKSIQHDYSFNSEVKSLNETDLTCKNYEVPLNINISKIFNRHYYDLGELGRIKLNNRLNLKISQSILNLTYQDLISIVDELNQLNLSQNTDDIDHLKNRRVRSVGELLQNQFRIGLISLERIIKERLTICDPLLLKPKIIINAKPLTIIMKEFFGSSQLSQFMDQTNPLSTLTHKRRISCLGPGGLNKDRISFVVRDIHPSHYGRICPIETPEGQNAGLISSLAICARISEYGFIESPFWQVKNGQIIKTKFPIYLTADIEDNFKIAQGDTPIDDQGFITKKSISVRYKQEFLNVSKFDVEFIAILTIQVVSAAASLIPFFEHDDANRALMGSNMQRQSVPLLTPQKPIVGTGLENQIACDSGMTITAFKSGVVIYVSSTDIVIEEDSGNNFKYLLKKYNKSNQNTCINQRPIVWLGQKVKSGQIIADGPSTENGELSLGQNIIVAYMAWEGYNFEDAILINERLIYEDVFTSIHIEKYDVEVRQTKVGMEEITRNIPNTTSSNTKNLDKFGIIYKGSFVKPEDILVGKLTPRGESDLLPEEKLVRAIFGEKATQYRDSSLRLPHGKYGRILEIKIFTKETGHELSVGSVMFIRVFLAQIRKIQVGDKIAGRHGNKGIISRVLKRQDMPYLPDGTPIDVILNPLGVPSRMNVGQLYECLLGLAGDKLNRRFKILPFDEMYGDDVSRILINKKLRAASIKCNEAWVFNPYSPGKILLTDGRTGCEFENPVTVGKTYMLKLVHLVDDKIHARSIGPYSLVTQQPLGGKSQHGGQRFGEMEVWALEAFGAAYTLQELLTIKSDDIQGRNDVLNAIIKGHVIPKSGLPESFKVLIRELQSIGIDISAYKIEIILNSQKEKNTEINLMEVYDEKSKCLSPLLENKNLFF